MSLTLWLVRHGETDSNAERTFQGHLDIHLNERGEQQACDVGAFLSEVEFDAVYASDLQRAARTAELIVGDRAAIILDADLREMHYGVLQGVRYAEAASALADHGYAESWTDGTFQRGGTTIPGGESYRRLRYRSRTFVNRLDSLFLDDSTHDVLVVAHGGKLGMLMTVLLDLPMRSRSSFRFANCGITSLTRTAENTTLEKHNLVVWQDNGSPASMFPARSDRRPDSGESHLPHS